MTFTARPHDLLWLRTASALLVVQDSWMCNQWHTGLPVVVRRDVNKSGFIPVGVRGERREQRAAGWVKAADIARVVTPEMLADREQLLRSALFHHPVVQAALTFSMTAWPWRWGITGSTGYALATQILALHANSDLDLLIRAPKPLARDLLQQWQTRIETLPCRVDTQVETPSGAFALTEWLREGHVLLKTATGPLLTASPWDKESQ